MAKMRMFLRETTVGREPLAVSMSSIRAGERVLQVGVDDPRIVHAIAAKVDITGFATVVAPTESAADRVRTIVGEGSAAIDPRIEPLDRLPFEGATYDVAVVHNVEGLLAKLEGSTRQHALQEIRRVLRPGGRVMVLEPGTPSGMRALFRSGPKPDAQYEAGGGSIAALELAGFAAVRLLGDREGYRFVEGVKPA